jgi:hypothetical protein
MPTQNTLNDETLRANIEWHIELIAIQIEHAKNVKGRARSGYYKIATILAASIVEAILHGLLIRKLGADGVILTGEKEVYECHPLPKKFYPDTGEDELVIGKRRPEKIKIARNPDFAVLNNTCFKEKVFSKRLFKKVDSVRKMRNKIHIQGLTYVDRSYTKNNVETASVVVNNLIGLYNQQNRPQS